MKQVYSKLDHEFILTDTVAVYGPDGAVDCECSGHGDTPEMARIDLDYHKLELVKASALVAKHYAFWSTKARAQAGEDCLRTHL